MNFIFPLNQIAYIYKIKYNQNTKFVYFIYNNLGDMVIMSENIIENNQIYKSLALSEKQIQDGEVIEAKESIKSLREKYGIHTD